MIHRHIMLSVAAFGLCASMPVESPNEDSAIKVQVELIDNSDINGHLSQANIDITTSFADLTVPLDRIRLLTFSETSNQVTLEFSNDDILTGTFMDNSRSPREDQEKCNNNCQIKCLKYLNL